MQTTPLQHRTQKPTRPKYEVVKKGRVLDTFESEEGAKAYAQANNGTVRPYAK